MSAMWGEAARSISTIDGRHIEVGEPVRVVEAFDKRTYHLFASKERRALNLSWLQVVERVDIRE